MSPPVRRAARSTTTALLAGLAVASCIPARPAPGRAQSGGAHCAPAADDFATGLSEHVAFLYTSSDSEVVSFRSGLGLPRLPDSGIALVRAEHVCRAAMDALDREQQRRNHSY